jgi:RNA polymerase sigma-70 factor (ECF subfamily)
MEILEPTREDSRKRDPVEFAQIVRENDADLQRVAYVISRDQEITRDAVQATWEIAWRRLPDAAPSAQRAWLITVAANAAKREVRRSRMRSILQMRGSSEPPKAPVDRSELIDLSQAYDRLAVRDRQLLSLRYGVGLSSEEIGPLVGLSASGVRVRIGRLLPMLKKELADER